MLTCKINKWLRQTQSLKKEFFYKQQIFCGDHTYNIELALAGFGKDDIVVEYKENQLTVKSKPNKDDVNEVEKYDNGVLHRGISKRFFSKSFTIANDVEVKGAELKDGLLKVRLEKIVPEGKKPRTIKIK